MNEGISLYSFSVVPTNRAHCWGKNRRCVPQVSTSCTLHVLQYHKSAHPACLIMYDAVWSRSRTLKTRGSLTTWVGEGPWPTDTMCVHVYSHCHRDRGSIMCIRRSNNSKVQKSSRTNCTSHRQNNLYKVIWTLNSRSCLQFQTNHSFFGV